MNCTYQVVNIIMRLTRNLMAEADRKVTSIITFNMMMASTATNPLEFISGGPQEDVWS